MTGTAPRPAAWVATARRGAAVVGFVAGVGLSACDLDALPQALRTVWAPAPPTPPTHTVARGESLGGIAKRHGTTAAALRALNDLDGDLIHPGQVLVLPGAQPGPAVKPPRSGAKPPRSGSGSSRAKPQRPPGDLPPGPCAPGPSLEAGDHGMAASEGLSAAAVERGVRGVLDTTAACVEPPAPAGTLWADLRIRCDGRVVAAAVADDPGWPPNLTACVLDALRTAQFPAHSLPDGDEASVPVRFVASP